MQILVDTGILLRAFDRTSSYQRPILKTFQRIWNRGDEMVATHQNIAEFWNVATRPASARGGFGLDAVIVEKQVSTIEKLGQLVPFDEVAYGIWRQILLNLTLNGSDFQRYPNIVSWTPYDFV